MKELIKIEDCYSENKLETILRFKRYTKALESERDELRRKYEELKPHTNNLAQSVLDMSNQADDFIQARNKSEQELQTLKDAVREFLKEEHEPLSDWMAKHKKLKSLIE